MFRKEMKKWKCLDVSATNKMLVKCCKKKQIGSNRIRLT